MTTAKCETALLRLSSINPMLPWWEHTQPCFYNCLLFRHSHYVVQVWSGLVRTSTILQETDGELHQAGLQEGLYAFGSIK